MAHLFEILHLDYLGPLRTSSCGKRDSFGYWCILWLDNVFCFRNADAITAAMFSIKKLFHNMAVQNTGLTHAKLVSLTSPCCSSWPARMNTPQGQQRTAEQRWVRWLQWLTRRWSCVNNQLQFYTQMSYRPTYMTHDLYHLLLFNHWLWHKIWSHQFGNPFFKTRAQPFGFRQWLHVYAVKIGTSYFGDLFSICQQVLGHPCHIWYSLGLKS